jgi:hypothetical protein
VGEGDADPVAHYRAVAKEDGQGFLQPFPEAGCCRLVAVSREPASESYQALARGAGRGGAVGLPHQAEHLARRLSGRCSLRLRILWSWYL